MLTWARILVAIAGLMGTAGVLLAAAGSHAGGGDLAHLSAEFLLIHASVVLSLGMGSIGRSESRGVWLTAASAMAAGAMIFSADLAWIAFSGSRPFRIAAPIGGLSMIGGWLILTIGGAIALKSGD